MGEPALRQVLSFLARGWSIPIFYVVFLVAVYVKFGFLAQFTLGAVALAIVPAVAYVKQSSDFLRNSALFVTLLLVYEALQGITGLLVSQGNVITLAGVDQGLFGFDFVAAVQTTFASSAATLISTIFYGLHFLLIVVAVVLFWFTSKRVYRSYAHSMVLTSYLALVTFVIIPSAPPWIAGTASNLLTSGYVMLPPWLATIQNVLLSVESDKFAAFPSLHVAYATIFSVYVIKLNRRYSIVAIPVPIGVYFAVIYLGQHYVIDIVGGVAYSLGSILVVEKLIPRLRQSRIMQFQRPSPDVSSVASGGGGGQQ